MGLQNAINNRPVRVLGFVTALHSIIYGTGFLSGKGGYNGALVGLAVNDNMITFTLGALLLTVGIFLAWAYARLNPKTIRYVSYAQGLIWMFVGLLYLVNGAYLLALSVGFTWTTISLYCAYATKNRKNILAYDRTEAAERDTDNEDTL